MSHRLINYMVSMSQQSPQGSKKGHLGAGSESPPNSAKHTAGAWGPGSFCLKPNGDTTSNSGMSTFVAI